MTDFEVVLRSDTAMLVLVRDLARKAAEMAGLDAVAAQDVALAVDECATNVIEHAYLGANDREYTVRFSRDGDRLVIEVLDDGVSLDTGALPAVDLKRYANERRKGGLGVHLMSKIMDSVVYSRERGCNVCRLVRNLGSGRDGTK